MTPAGGAETFLLLLLLNLVIETARPFRQEGC